MHTVLTRSPEEAARFIRAGETVAFPTETVYGLGADLYQADAVRKIYAAKDRPADNPLIAHIYDLKELPALAAKVSPAAEKLIRAFFPGPLTVVLPKSEQVPAAATAGLSTIGVRMPRHHLAREFLRWCGTTVAAPSANRSGRPSPTTWQAVERDLGGRISCLLQGERTEVGLESTVVDCSGAADEPPLLLRPGAVTLEQLRAVVPAVRAAAHPDEFRKSPGTRHRHYAPRARVRLVRSADEVPAAERSTSGYIGLDAPTAEDDAAADFALRRVCRHLAEYAHELFDFFRECDARQVRAIYCQQTGEIGLGLALMDRLRRAAEEK